MSLPILEQIALAIKTSLETITVANGYYADVAAVERPTRTGGITPRDKLIVLEQGNWKPAEEQDSASNCITKVQTFFVTLWLRQSEKSTDAIDARTNYFQADVEKALMADSQYGGLALLSNLSGGVILESDSGELEGIMLLLDVQYRTKWGDPYSLP